MEKELIVRGAPQEFVCETGAWQTLPRHLERRGLQRILVLKGTKSWEVAERFFPELPNYTVAFHTYQGESTYEERDFLVEKIVEENWEAVVAVGGGKITDLAKAAAIVSNKPVIIFPTLASTCAAYTPLSVMYSPEGSMIRYDVFPRSNGLVLLDPEVILHSPKELLIAGIGDTLAKWYEADVIIRQLEQKPVEVEIAHFTAKLCRDNLLQYSEAALTAMEAGELNEAFVKIVETNIMVGGMVGGFGDDYGRCAGAHSIHDALTILPETHHLLHGNKVAYGIFVQLVLEGNWQEIDTLLPFYQSLQLPASLVDLGLAELPEARLAEVADRAASEHETIHLMPGKMTADKVLQAIDQLEIFMEKKRIQV